MKINTALILCAGYGKRLNPLTLSDPKPLLKINEITLLENCINLIESLEIKKIIINTFHLKDKIEDFLKTKKFNLDIKIINDGKIILNTGGGLLNMMNSSNDSNFLTFNPDTIWNKDYIKYIRDMEKFYFLNQIKNILLLVNKSLSYDKKLKGDFNLIGNKIRKDDQNNLIYTGCQIINKELFKSNLKSDFSISEIWNKLVYKNELYGYESKENFFHLTNLEIYKELLKNKQILSSILI
ncbi:sugar phosphate nucleotidyltransferase [Candidatus Pelagibacter sp.]|nr:sugar phosphate nucleotidyltransferase [Candidatus Pelagibacter sp.]